jgi:hypothetical protein
MKFKKGSIFRKYKYCNNNINNYNLFFGNNLSSIITYNKDIDNKLFNLLEKINEVVDFQNIDDYSKDEIIVKKCILRCTKEILYDFIRFFNNFIDISKIDSITIVCYIIAYKFIVGYDFDSFPGYNFIIEFTKCYSSAKYLTLLEVNILQINDWNPCKKVYKRLIDNF